MAILAVLLLVAVGGLSSAVLSSLKLSRTAEESARADEAARALAARMQSVPFLDLFKLYNADPNDHGAAQAPGAAFDVRGLAPRGDDPDGRVGRIVFPTVDLPGGGQVLREDVVDARLGMPDGRDLDGDGAIEPGVNVGIYVLLPARLIVEWTGAGGDRSYELDLVLAR